MSTHVKPQTARPGVLSLNVSSRSALYAAYMPFLSHAGLFVPTSKHYTLGDEVFMLVQLMDDPTRHPVAGRVAWITPPGAQGNRVAGIGVQFAESSEGDAARTRIEAVLAGILSQEKPTHTM